VREVDHTSNPNWLGVAPTPDLGSASVQIVPRKIGQQRKQKIACQQGAGTILVRWISRPKGARNKLGEEFIKAVQAD
jgi:hypothetical protein